LTARDLADSTVEREPAKELANQGDDITQGGLE
jgi:hypothetical protein